MAALINHVLSNSRSQFSYFHQITRQYAVSGTYGKKKHYKIKREKVQMPECRKLESTERSVACRGFLRTYKQYDPPADVKDRVKKIFEEIVGPVSSGQVMDGPTRFSVLSACFNDLGHSVPNSVLHKIKSFDELLMFYSTPVDTTLPLNKLKKMDLPENLHIQYEYLRFLPDEDTLFNGQTAFPESNTLVTGLRTRRKYKGAIVTHKYPKL